MGAPSFQVRHLDTYTSLPHPGTARFFFTFPQVILGIEILHQCSASFSSTSLTVNPPEPSPKSGDPSFRGWGSVTGSCTGWGGDVYVSKCLYLRHLDTYTSLRSLPLETSAQRKHCKQAPSQAKHLAFVRHAEGMRGRGIRGGILGVFGGIRVIFGVFGRTCPILDLAVVANLIMNSRPTFPFIKLKGKKRSEKGDPEAHAGASRATVLKFYEPSPLLFWSFGSENKCLPDPGPV